MPGIAGTLPATWRSYSNIEEARLSALAMMREPRVRRVAIVEDINVLELVEWMDPRHGDDRSAASHGTRGTVEGRKESVSGGVHLRTPVARQ